MLEQRTRLLLILLILSTALHSFKLAEPRQVVFDEVHFGGFVNAYLEHRLFFDIHPPHAKLLIAGVTAAGGYRGDQPFQELGGPIDKVSTALLRLVPAIAGTLIPLVLFCFLIQLGASPMAAFLGGLAVLLDNGMLVQTRLIALDGVLLLAIFGSLTCFLAALQCTDRVRRTRLSLFAGLLAGLAAGSKFTGLAALALMGATLAIDFLMGPSWRKFRVGASHSVWILTGTLVVYTSGWLIHFWILNDPIPGSGFGWPTPTGDFVADLVDIHQKMLSANYGLRVEHPHSSFWWGWPLMTRPIFYWDGHNGTSIHFVGNPVVWWGTTLGLVVVAANLVLVKVTDLELPNAIKSWPRWIWVPALGYLIAFAPLIPVERPLFLYHYLSPLLFALCFTLLWLDHVGWTRPGGFRNQRPSYFVATIILVLGFCSASPFMFPFIKWPEYKTLMYKILPIWS
jgi:dolichyl-phosphate-mannose-protein mannosyltransferase